MKTIPLFNSVKFIIVDDEDHERLSAFKWYLRTSTIQRNESIKASNLLYRNGWRTINISIASEVMQKAGVLFDHRDNDIFNNQKYNLRESTKQQNASNRYFKPRLNSKYKGVHKRGLRWRAMIRFNKKLIHLGTFPTQEDAAKAYDTKAVELFGSFANLNFKV